MLSRLDVLENTVQSLAPINGIDSRIEGEKTLERLEAIEKTVQNLVTAVGSSKRSDIVSYTYFKLFKILKNHLL